MARAIEVFAATLATMDDYREVDLAVAFIWFLGHQDNHTNDVAVRDVASIIAECRLRASINVSRLAAALAKHPDIVRGRSPSTFRVRASSESRLKRTFAAHISPSSEPVLDLVIDASISLGGRSHLEQIRREANGCFERGFYNGSAVMCRRLVELLLIEAFTKADKLAAIVDSNGNLRALSDIIAVAKTRQHVRLSRAAPNILDKVKEVGDAAAHHRFYNTRRGDIEALNPSLSHLIAELGALAGL